MAKNYHKKLEFSAKLATQIFVSLELTGHHSRFVGGCVRNALLGKFSDDHDIATTLLPEQVILLLGRNNIKVIATGIKFGTVTAYLQDEYFEITTLRKESNYQGRFPQVVFTDDFELDASRRDFTINALSYCPKKQLIYDYFGGTEDLAEQKIVFIGDATSRIVEDPLRILRFFRFNCYYGRDNIDAVGLAASTNLKKLLSTLSKERIIAELNKIVVHPNSAAVLYTMFQTNILPEILPITIFKQQTIKDAFLYAEKLQYKIEPTIIYALIFFDNSSLQANDLLALKFSKKQASLIIKLISSLQVSMVDQYLLNALLLEEQLLQYIIVALSIKKLSFEAAQQFLKTYDKAPVFPIKGNDLAPMLAGEQLGRQLIALRQLWIRSDFKLSKIELLAEFNKKFPKTTTK